MLFPSPTISSLVFDSNHTWWVHLEACVCARVTDLFITRTIPAWRQFSVLLLHLTCSVQHQNQFSLTLHCTSKLWIFCCQTAQLSIMWQPLASQTVIGCVLHTGRPSFTICCEYLNRRYRMLCGTIMSLSIAIGGIFTVNVHIDQSYLLPQKHDKGKCSRREELPLFPDCLLKRP